MKYWVSRHNPSDRAKLLQLSLVLLRLMLSSPSARKAYRTWRLVPAPARAEYIYRVGELLLKYKEELAQLISREMGKPLTQARGDVPEGIDCAYYSAGEGRRLGEILTEGELKDGYPTILDGVTLDMRIAWEEIFGPVVALIEVNSFEEATTNKQIIS